MEWKWNGDSVKNIIKLSEVESYIDKLKDSTFKMAISVLLCIMSPAVLIVLSGISEGIGVISEKTSDIAGISVIILMAAIAVYMFVRGLMELGKNDAFYLLTKKEKMGHLLTYPVTLEEEENAKKDNKDNK